MAQGYIFVTDYLGSQSDRSLSKATQLLIFSIASVFLFFLGEHKVASFALGLLILNLIGSAIIDLLYNRPSIPKRGFYLDNDSLVIRSPREFINLATLDTVTGFSVLGLIYFVEIRYSLNYSTQQSRYFVLSKRGLSNFLWYLNQSEDRFRDISEGIRKCKPQKPLTKKYYSKALIDSEGDDQKKHNFILTVIYFCLIYVFLYSEFFQGILSNLIDGGQDISNVSKYNVAWPKGSKEQADELGIRIISIGPFVINGVSFLHGGECRFDRGRERESYSCHSDEGLTYHDLRINGPVEYFHEYWRKVEIRASLPSEYRGVEYKRNQGFYLSEDGKIVVKVRGIKRGSLETHE